MTIKVVRRDEVDEYKLDVELQKMKEMEVAMVVQIKESLFHLTDIDYLYDLQDYIDELVRGWDDRELETEDYEDDED